MAVDTATVEIIRAKFNAAAERMRITLIKTAYNIVISEVLDFGCAIFDGKVQMLAQGIGLPIFQGHLGFPIQVTLDARKGEKIFPGDLFMHNDPYDGNGNHLNDVAYFSPVFHDGNVIGWCAVKAHWIDIGGAVPSSLLIDSTDFRQEGLRFQAVKLYDRGVRNEELMRVIAGNVRTETGVLKDAEAMAAVCRIGVAAFEEIIATFGYGVVAEAIDTYLGQSEKRTRAALSAFPSGTYSAEGYFDNDGITLDKPVRVAVKVTIDDGQMTVDCTGSSPQVAGPFNCGEAITISTCRLLIKALMTPDEPADEGSFRPLKVIAPAGCVLAAREPVPTGRYYAPINLLMELCLRALSEAAPDRIPAGAFADQMPTALYGSVPGSRDVFVLADINGGGTGARPADDGQSGLSIFLGSTARNSPIEVSESRNPHVQILNFGLRTNSGGKGKYRGGLGIERAFRFDIPVFGTFTLERKAMPPWGVRGGGNGAPNEVIIVDPDGQSRSVRKATRHPVAAGATIIVRSGGGGGFGPPDERDDNKITEDVREGYVSADAAKHWRQLARHAD